MFGLSPLSIIAICIAFMIILGLYMVISVQTRIKKRVRNHIFVIIRTVDGIFDFQLLPIKGTKIKAPEGNKDVPGGMWVIENQNTVGTCEYPPLYPKFFQTRVQCVLVQRGNARTMPFDNKVEYLTEAALISIDNEKTAETIAMVAQREMKREAEQNVMKLSLMQLIIVGVVILGIVFNVWLSVQNVNTLQHLLMAMGYQ